MGAIYVMACLGLCAYGGSALSVTGDGESWDSYTGPDDPWYNYMGDSYGYGHYGPDGRYYEWGNDDKYPEESAEQSGESSQRNDGGIDWGGYVYNEESHGLDDAWEDAVDQVVEQNPGVDSGIADFFKSPKYMDRLQQLNADVTAAGISNESPTDLMAHPEFGPRLMDITLDIMRDMGYSEETITMIQQMYDSGAIDFDMLAQLGGGMGVGAVQPYTPENQPPNAPQPDTRPPSEDSTEGSRNGMISPPGSLTDFFNDLATDGDDWREFFDQWEANPSVSVPSNAELDKLTAINKILALARHTGAMDGISHSVTSNQSGGALQMCLCI